MTESSSTDLQAIDNVRASRAGHTYHDTWAAHIALELLHPKTTLAAISMEGLSTEEVQGFPKPATEIADLVRYRGARTAEHADGVEVMQFKYSTAHADAPMRASDVAKTITKFAIADSEFLKRFGRSRVDSVVRYEFVTNRPFHPSFETAVESMRESQPFTDSDVQQQGDAIRIAVGLDDTYLYSFLRRVTFTGTAGSTRDVRAAVHKRIASWSGASDTISRMRLESLCRLIQDKASPTGQHNNLIDRVSMLAVLEIAHEEELFPTPAAFPSLDYVIDRPFCNQIAADLWNSDTPLLLHSAGGMGKTVLMQTVAQTLPDINAVVLFDCFGAGQWRNPADGRHEPKKALLHIANVLAAQGLCDILIAPADETDLMRAFLQRLQQSVRSLRVTNGTSSVVLVLDAIDHSALQANATSSKSFAHLVLQSLSISPVEGVRVLASCRTERIELAVGSANCRKVSVPKFSPAETGELVQRSDPHATAADTSVLHSRSGGNPRVLDALLRAGKPYEGNLTFKDSASPVSLDSLIEEQMNHARQAAISRGVSHQETETLLSGLALLPPPVPASELANAHGLSEASVQSFTSDLFPLVEYTTHGLIFRDEPTETFVRSRFRASPNAIQQIVGLLQFRQEESSYAARSLPIVLTELKRTDELVTLAFDDRLPKAADSEVAKRSIRLARLAAALIVCARESRADDLARLLLEIARVAGGHDRSDRFLQEHPELVAVSRDSEAMRRLFETKTRWAGSRHAALAIAYSYVGDQDEARRHARRTFGWLQWRAESDRDSRPRQRDRTDDQDYFGPVFVEILNGNWVRAVRWVNQFKEDYTYSWFAHIATLLSQYGTLQNPVDRLKCVRAASRCRSKSRSFFAAILHHLDLEPIEEHRALRRLADVCATPRATSRDFHARDRALDFRTTLVALAIRAFHLGLRLEAQIILNGAGLSRPTLHDYDTIFSYEDVSCWVLASALRAALEGRVSSLIDIAPSEVFDAVRVPKRGNKAAEFESRLSTLLNPPTAKAVVGRKKKRKGSKEFDYRAREEASRTLSNRVRPLVSHVAALAAIISEPTPANVQAAFEQVRAAANSGSDYPYHDGTRYLPEITFTTLFSVAEAARCFSKDFSRDLTDWLTASSLTPFPLWTRVTARLSRVESARDSAIRLARRTADQIADFTDIDGQITAYGSLARAVFLASRDEATSYFRRGLVVADAIGSDDFDRSRGLLQFAAQYSGPPVGPEVAHGFARICELNLSDDTDKYDWNSYGRALAQLAGLDSLAIISRLADRERADLSASFPTLLTSLVEANHVSPTIAAGLIGLADPFHRWGWSLADLVVIILPQLPREKREVFGGFVVREIDRQYLSSLPAAEILDKLLECFQAHLPADSPSLSIVSQWKAASNEDASERSFPELPVKLPLRDEDEVSIPDDFDVGDPNAIDLLIASSRKARSAQRWGFVVLSQLKGKINSLDGALRFVDALCKANEPELVDKLSSISYIVETWGSESASLVDALPRLVKELATRHAPNLCGDAWDASFDLRRLVEMSRDSGLSIVTSVIDTLRERAVNVGSAAWMNFANVVAKTASPQAVALAIQRFVETSVSSLPESIGDGPWAPNLSVTGDAADCVGGLLWFRLGSPDVRERWRAAHALCRLAEIGEVEILSRVFRHTLAKDAHPFSDPKLPFYDLDAMTWLLITTARIAQARPDAVILLVPRLETIATDSRFPHVVMQHFAATALKNIAPQLEYKDRTRLLNTLASINVSQFPPAPQTRRDTFYSGRPAEQPKPDDAFHFDYDFGKYDIDRIATVFGCPHWEVEDACNRWVRSWSETVKSMWDCPRRGRSREIETRGSGRPVIEKWGSYLAWHALMLTAGEFLKTRSLRKSRGEEDGWSDWLERQLISPKDGLWLADATDLVPLDVRRKLPRDVGEGVPAIKNTLAQFAGLNADFTLRDSIIVDGFWDIAGGIDIRVDSLLVDNAYVNDAAFAVAVQAPYDQWFPNMEHDYEYETEELARCMRPLTESLDHHDCEFDRNDPYAARTALSRPFPQKEIVGLDLKRHDTFGRAWGDETTGVACEGAAWGGTKGEGRHVTDHDGQRLAWQTKHLLEFLRNRQQSLILLVKGQKYWEDRKEGDRFETTTFLTIVQANGKARVIQRVPKTIRSLIQELPEERRYSFWRRLEALRMGKP